MRCVEGCLFQGTPTCMLLPPKCATRTTAPALLPPQLATTGLNRLVNKVRSLGRGQACNSFCTACQAAAMPRLPAPGCTSRALLPTLPACPWVHKPGYHPHSPCLPLLAPQYLHSAQLLANDDFALVTLSHPVWSAASGRDRAAQPAFPFSQTGWEARWPAAQSLPCLQAALSCLTKAVPMLQAFEFMWAVGQEGGDLDVSAGEGHSWA